MSKFILSNSIEKIRNSVSQSKEAGYSVSGVYENQDTAYACYHKLSINNQNFLTIGNDFVSIIGTVIYKDYSEKDALEHVYNDYDGNVNTIRNNVIGNGAFIIKKGDSITVFCEYLGLYNIFYTINDGILIVSNDIYDLCKQCKGLEADNDNLLLRSLMAGVYDQDTVIKGVKYLRDNEVIHLNVITGKYEITKVDADWRSHELLSYEEVIACIGDLLKEYAAKFAKHFGAPALSSTGGLDNRLNLASFLAAGIKPDLYYGVGNSSVTNTFNGDLEINKLYAEKFGLNLNVISWENSTPITKDWDETEKLYGTLSTVYSGSKKFSQDYRNIKNKSIFFGCFGEIYRIDDNTYLEDNNFADYTLDQYIDWYPIGHYYEPAQLLFHDTENIHKHIKTKLLPLCEKWALNPDCLTAMDDIILWLERMHRSDVYVPNLINRHHYCAFLNAQFKIVRLLTLVHPRDKQNAKFHIDLLKYLYPSVMEIPVFSRCRLWHYDNDSNMIKLPRLTLMKRYVKKLLPGFIVDSMLTIRDCLKNDEKSDENKIDNESIPVVKDILLQHEIIDGKDVKVAIRGRLSKSVVLYAQFLSIFDHLGIKFIKTKSI